MVTQASECPAPPFPAPDPPLTTGRGSILGPQKQPAGLRRELREQGLVLAYIFIPKPCFKFQSGFQSCNNNRGREEEKKKRKKANRSGCQLSGLLNWQPGLQSPGRPAPGEARAGPGQGGGCSRLPHCLPPSPQPAWACGVRARLICKPGGGALEERGHLLCSTVILGKRRPQGEEAAVLQRREARPVSGQPSFAGIGEVPKG